MMIMRNNFPQWTLDIRGNVDRDDNDDEHFKGADSTTQSFARENTRTSPMFDLRRRLVQRKSEYSFQDQNELCHEKKQQSTLVVSNRILKPHFQNLD